MKSMTFRSCIKRTLAFFKSLFLSGLFTITPIAFTVFFINFAYGFVYKTLAPLRQMEPTFLQNIPGSEFALATILILVMGFTLKTFIVGGIVHYFERLISKIPFIRIVYSSSKIVVDFFKVTQSQQISAQNLSRQVVLIQYPRKGNFHIAFLLESAQDDYEKLIPNDQKNMPDEPYCKVFMPNSPNPTSGYFFILPKSEIVPTNITFEEAIKTIVSCGLATPESLKK
jgi:uncharacterized membrane protein